MQRDLVLGLDPELTRVEYDKASGVQFVQLRSCCVRKLTLSDNECVIPQGIDSFVSTMSPEGAPPLRLLALGKCVTFSVIPSLTVAAEQMEAVFEDFLNSLSSRN